MIVANHPEDRAADRRDGERTVIRLKRWCPLCNDVNLTVETVDLFGRRT